MQRLRANLARNVRLGGIRRNACTRSRRLITRRSQVQILPPLLKRSAERGPLRCQGRHRNVPRTSAARSLVGCEPPLRFQSALLRFVAPLSLSLVASAPRRKAPGSPAARFASPVHGRSTRSTTTIRSGARKARALAQGRLPERARPPRQARVPLLPLPTRGRRVRQVCAAQPTRSA
jgi:hypothetical protein